MELKESLKTGISFGLTSGIITTLGLMVGLHAGTNSKMVVIGGIFTIAIADAFSDALGIHVSEESENRHSSKEIWESTISTFLSKFVFAIMFILPVIFFELTNAIIISIVTGLVILSIISFNLPVEIKGERWKVVAEHIIIALAVIMITHYVGDWVSLTFK
jgi:VIT1/CCC1 family predicted Fe2+/Mn2+ transporter